MNNNQKRYFHIDSGTPNGQKYSRYWIPNINEDKIDELMND